jgi:hypothetical protein
VYCTIGDKDLETVPAAITYLSAPSERVEHGAGRLSALAGFKVGVVWQGNRYHLWDHSAARP